MFSKKFQQKYALTDQGLKNTKKGAFWTVIVNLVVMGGVSILYLMMSGFMGTLITAANDAGFGLATMVIVGGALVWLFSFIMGSGNAAFFSFAPLLPNVAHVIGVPIIQLIFPLQVILGFGRASSPITGAIVAISGLAGVSPFQVAKRTFIPMLFGTAITYIAYFLFWY